MVRINVVELFAGKCSFSNVAKVRGHNTWTTDIDSYFDVDLVEDILNIELEDVPRRFREGALVWASPPCQSFSVMHIGRNWRITKDGQHIPRNERTYHALVVLAKALCLIRELEPRAFYIENPVDKMRSLPMMNEHELSAFFGRPVYRRTITQCQYGRSCMKPTDIWTDNLDWIPKPPCHNGDPCHERAPRGSLKGVQGEKLSRDRAIIPPQLCLECLTSIKERKMIQTHLY